MSQSKPDEQKTLLKNALKNALESSSLTVDVKDSSGTITVTVILKDLNSGSESWFFDNIIQKIYKIVNFHLPRKSNYQFLVIKFSEGYQKYDATLKFNASILLEPNEYLWIFNKKIDVLLEE